MMRFTPQESRILIFLVVTLLLGSAVSLFRHYRSGDQSEVAVIPAGDGQAVRADSLKPGGGPEAPAEKLNINRATEKELQTLPGIGPSLAQRIVEYRQSQGSFSSTQQITAVRGIGQKTYQRIQGVITIE